MSTVVDERPCATSAYTCLNRSPFAPADDTSRFTRSPEDSPEDGWGELIDQLIDFGCLQDDWDGAGSVAPDPGVVAGAIKLAWALRAKKEPAAGRVTASVNGTICFEWHTADGYQEIEVETPIDAEQRWVAKGAKIAEVTPIAIA